MQNYKDKNLIELINLAQNNDENAINELVKRYQDKIYKSFRNLNPEADLPDLTQEALLKMTNSINSLKNPEKFNPWLQKIIHNLFYDAMRTKNKNKKIFTDNPIDYCAYDFGPCIIDSKKTPDENFLSCELKKKITKAISDLPPIFKTIILLREIEGLSYEKIADLTSLNIGTVKSRLARARIKLKNELKDYIQ